MTRERLLLAAACGFFFFFRLGAIGLVGPDEPRYAQVAREMLARGDWVTPVLYHHTWLEKPILLYWAEMISYRLFGVSDWAARVPAAVAATLLVVGGYVAVGRIRPLARLDAALMIASSVLVLGFARAAATDMLLASPWCLSLLAWYCWYESQVSGGPFQPAVGLSGVVPPHDQKAPLKQQKLEWATRQEKVFLYLFYLLNAVAMLAKGPVAPGLAALVLIAFCATRRDLRALARSVDPLGILLFAAVAAPWYVLVQLRTPEFFRIFFLQHNLERFGSNLYRHKQPFWYYAPAALIAALPWTLWVLHGLGDGLRALRPGRRPQPGPHSPAAAPSEPDLTFELYLLLWALVPITFFSISRSKLPGYILPAVPALLILAAVAVHRRVESHSQEALKLNGAPAPRRFAAIVHAVLLGMPAAAVGLAPRLMLKRPLSALVVAIAALAGTIVFLLATIALRSGWRWLRSVTLLPVILIVGFILRDLAPVVDATQSARPVALLLQQIAGQTSGMQDGVPVASPPTQSIASLPVATFGLSRNLAFGLAFYLNHRVDRYEGLEISPAVYELPPAVPASAHLLVMRDTSVQALPLLLSGRTIQHLASYPPQHLEIVEVSAAH